MLNTSAPELDERIAQRAAELAGEKLIKNRENSRKWGTSDEARHIVEDEILDEAWKEATIEVELEDVEVISEEPALQNPEEPAMSRYEKYLRAKERAEFRLDEYECDNCGGDPDTCVCG